MYAYEFRNAEEALPEMLRAAERLGVERDSRNGPVKQFPKPVAIRYEKPTERVLLHPERDANPFFHLMEAVWMLGGRNDVAFPSRFVKTFGQFSDDGRTFNGAYGYRWRYHFTVEGEKGTLGSIDQIKTVVHHLREDPDNRRMTVTMFDPRNDLGLASKDIPCNLTATVQINTEGALDLTVYNRSNDLIWGALGANVVHFSVLQEYLALLLGVPVGAYEQVSANMHVYLNDVWKKCEPLIDLTNSFSNGTYGHAGKSDYARRTIEPYPMGTNAPIDDDIWLQDISAFLAEGPIVGCRIPWLRRVVFPVYSGWGAYAKGREAARETGDKSELVSGIDAATEIIATQCKALDWKAACIEWLDRRKGRAMETLND